VAPLPDSFEAGGVGGNSAWDAIGDALYASPMGKDAYRFRR
jgi:hypothetical protein